MKKLLLVFLVASSVICCFAQSWSSSTGVLYTNPTTTKIGIGLNNPSQNLQVLGGLKIGNSSSSTDRSKSILYFGDGSYVQIGEWDADDVLSFKANSYRFQGGYIGINAIPIYELDVKGRVYIRNTVSGETGWNYSYLHWTGHSLVMGSPAGIPMHNSVDLVPGGANSISEPLYSCLRMYTATAENTQVQRIELRSEGNCWFKNTGNIGIGTNLPTHKLDVRGTIRANEILVNIPSGADFVFEDNYKLMPLSQLSSYIRENKHLPEIAPAKSMEENGITMGEMQIKLLQKIEELTLYVIQQKAEIENLKKQIENR